MLFDPYQPEWQVYDLTPHRHRWIYNKIELGHKLGYKVGPVGVRLPKGEYCVRPVMNVMGSAKGGFRKVVLKHSGFIQEPVGYCWTMWTDELRSWSEYIDDECVYRQRTVQIDGDTEHMIQCKYGTPLESPLQNISRYMLVERLGNTVIDVSPRHLLDEMNQKVVDDYRTFDPDYEPPAYGEWGFSPTMRRYEVDGVWYLEDVPTCLTSPEISKIVTRTP